MHYSFNLYKDSKNEKKAKYTKQYVKKDKKKISKW